MMSENGLRERNAPADFARISNTRVAFLRFNVAGLKQRESSDWDVAVENRRKIGLSTEKLYGTPWLLVERQYVEQRYYDWGQLDFLPVFEWNGIEFLSQDRFWKHVKKGDDGFPRPCLAHDALIAWMTGLLWGGEVSLRYRPLIKAAYEEDAVELRNVLEIAFGKGWAQELWSLVEKDDLSGAEKWVSQLRQALFYNQLKLSGGAVLKSISSHWLKEIELHLKPPFPWVAFLGPDGSGKSTVIAGVKERLKRSRVGIHQVHWRPKVRPVPESAVDAIVTDPHGGPGRGKALSLLSLVILMIRWWIAIPFRLLHIRAKRAIVISDRYYLDLLADPKRYRYSAPLSIAKICFKMLPRPRITVFLLTDAATILSRKAEVSAHELEKQLVRYRAIAKSMGDSAVIIDVSRAPDQVIDESCRLIVSALKGKS
ncbi:hypothetical protein N9F36_05110 [Akkermansiaceae bacterium]|nr:hypothetical protein [Akkermansiaceae bacterium]MDB4804616.1 hypothetical protein [Akkermansiaceae bacterium]